MSYFSVKQKTSEKRKIVTRERFFFFYDQRIPINEGIFAGNWFLQKAMKDKLILKRKVLLFIRNEEYVPECNIHQLEII